MYNWLRDDYIDSFVQDLEEKIEDGQITEEEAEKLFNTRLEEQEAGYGDYMYDIMNDR